MNDKEQPLETWAIVELMGHVKRAGRLSEEEKFGAKMGRLDMPDGAGGFVTMFFGGSSVYRITVVTEAVARAVSQQTPVAPVSAWDFPKQLAGPSEKIPTAFVDDVDDDEEECEESLLKGRPMMEAEPLEAIRQAQEAVRVDPDARIRLENYAKSVEALDPAAASRARDLLAATEKEFSVHQNAMMNRQIEGIPGKQP